MLNLFSCYFLDYSIGYLGLAQLSWSNFSQARSIFVTKTINMVRTVRGSRGKIRGSGKVGEFYIPKSGRTWRVRESQGVSM